jgi:hypothetical protein
VKAIFNSIESDNAKPSDNYNDYGYAYAYASDNANDKMRRPMIMLNFQD